MRVATICAVLLQLTASAATAESLKLDETAAGNEEWGYRPAAGGLSQSTPPNFCWRP